MMEGRKDETFLMETNWVDYNYLETYGMTLASGRSLMSHLLPIRMHVLVNESASENFQITDIEKTRFIQPGDSGKMNICLLSVL